MMMMMMIMKLPTLTSLHYRQTNPIRKPPSHQASQPPNCNPKSQTKSRWQFSPLGGRRQEPSALYQLPNISPIQPRKRTAIGHRLCGTAPPEIEHCNWWNNLLHWHFWLPSILARADRPKQMQMVTELSMDAKCQDYCHAPSFIVHQLPPCSSIYLLYIYMA